MELRGGVNARSERVSESERASTQCCWGSFMSDATDEWCDSGEP